MPVRCMRLLLLPLTPPPLRNEWHCGKQCANHVFLDLLKARATMFFLPSPFHRLPLPQATARRMMSVAASLAMFVGAATAQGTDPVVARLGTIAIGQEEIERLLQALPSTERVAIKGNRGGLENWLRQRVASEALMREAQGKNWAARPEVKNRIDEAV